MDSPILFGLKNSQINEIRKIFQEIIQTPQSAEVWIFGSRAHEKHQPFDLVVRDKLYAPYLKNILATRKLLFKV